VTVTIIDYGAGNLRSVQNTLSELGAQFQVTRDPAVIAAAGRVILPGVGHIGQMMSALEELNLKGPIVEKARSGVPFLGICLGLQAMFEGSEEAPEAGGLGLFPGQVRRFPAGSRCPHMGWNEIVPVKDSRLLRGLAPKPYLYFAHSYYCPVMSGAAATCTYEVPCTAALESGNVFGVQFHPEKSGPLGLRIVKNFLEVE
jgi:imidazole glycerol phosphate synthase glutamine amidotransferase subunit